jgi:hypothetical protein
MKSSVKFINFLQISDSTRVKDWSKVLGAGLVLCSLLNQSVLVEDSEEFRNSLKKQRVEAVMAYTKLPVCITNEYAFLMNSESSMTTVENHHLTYHGYRYRRFGS